MKENYITHVIIEIQITGSDLKEKKLFPPIDAGVVEFKILEKWQ